MSIIQLLLATSADPGEATYLVVAGGGGGGETAFTQNGSGGGGAGGFRTGVVPVPTLKAAGAVTVTVGAGGPVGTTDVKYPGSPSVFYNITSAGGGAGGQFPINGGRLPGDNGGSGGGGTYTPGFPVAPAVSLYGAGNSPPTSPPQGNPGGGNNSINAAFGGGGGAGAAGGGQTFISPPNVGNGGNGGSGTASSITGSPVTYAGGGAGGGSGGGVGGTGGSGGGGNAPPTPSPNGTVNTGGGGGGGGPGIIQGGNGGSGIVIIKVPSATTITFSPGVTSSLSTAVAGFNIYSVTATSTASETATFS